VVILCGNTYLRSLTSCRQLFLTTNIPILCFEMYLILPHPQTGFVWSYQVEICFWPKSFLSHAHVQQLILPCWASLLY
jgi:hypothetical protein